MTWHYVEKRSLFIPIKRFAQGADLYATGGKAPVPCSYSCSGPDRMARCSGAAFPKEHALKTRYVTTLALALWLSVSGAAYTDPSPGAPSEHPSIAGENGKAVLFTGERFARTELFFGTAKPDGSEVTTEEFQK